MLSEERRAYLDRRIPEIFSRYEDENRQRKAFGQNCGKKEDRMAYCKEKGIRGKRMETILNIHRRK